MRIALLSDLHMFSKADPGRQAGNRETPSYLCTDADPSGGLGNPINDLRRLIKQRNLKADLLLCPGDLGDAASETGIRQAWQHVQEIATLLGGAWTMATPGNHDINHNHHEPDGCLRSLEAFPVADTALRNQFWADHFTIRDADRFRVVSLNSCASHETGDPERRHGRIGERTRTALGEALDRLPKKAIQVLLCHHHPHQHSDYSLGEHDVMKGGQLLLDLLGRRGNWLVVHGHKHHPKLTRAAGHSSAPWVLAAGSLAAMPNPATQGHARNQFYLLDIDTSSFDSLGWGGVGHAWDWATEDGWLPARRDSGLPARFAFGHTGDLSLLVRGLRPHIPLVTGGFVKWKALCTAVPMASRLSPRDIEELQVHGIRVEFGDDGCPMQLAREA